MYNCTGVLEYSSALVEKNFFLCKKFASSAAVFSKTLQTLQEEMSFTNDQNSAINRSDYPITNFYNSTVLEYD
jgi:hypothetical protein